MDDWNADPLDYAASCLEQGDIETALDTLSSLVIEDQTPPDQGRLLALEYVCYSAVGAEDTAKEFLDVLHGCTWDDPDVVGGAAIQFFQLELHEVAQFLLGEACREHPELAEMRFLLAIAMEELGDHADAAGLYGTAVDDEKCGLESYLGIARCAIETNRIDDAVTACRQYLAVRPTEDTVWISLGRMLLQGDHFEEADAAFAEAQSAGATGEALHLFRCASAARRGDFALVEACGDTMADAFPESWACRIVEGYVRGSEGDVWEGWESCLEGFHQACEENNGEEIAAATDAVIQYVLAFALADGLAKFAPRLYESGTFTFTALAALRRDAGAASDKALSFRLTIESAVSSPSLIEAIRDQSGQEPPFALLYVYGVMAESSDQAIAFVREFEKAGGAGAVTVHEIESVDGETTDHLGVWKREFRDVLYATDVSLN